MTNASDNVPGGAAGYGDGIDVDSTSNTVSVTDNTVTGGAENGISLFSTSGAQVTGNTTSNNRGDGIYVGGPGSTQTGNASNNTISDNTSSKNGQDGILADTLSSANTFSGNTLKKNVRYDIEDLSAGTGSGGTAKPRGRANTCKPDERLEPIRTLLGLSGPDGEWQAVRPCDFASDGRGRPSHPRRRNMT